MGYRLTVGNPRPPGVTMTGQPGAWAFAGGDAAMAVVDPGAWAAGADPGSYDSGTRVWTPGRTGDTVNYASWASVPTGEWVEVAGTRLDGLNAQIIAANLGWDNNSLAMGAVLNAWNGFAIDTNNARVWLVAAGGHGDSSNNGVYEFNAYKMAWSVRKMPSDRNAWSAGYRNLSTTGTFTACPESSAATPQAGYGEEAATAATRKYFFDQLYWDGAPTSRHTYSSAAYDPVNNQLILGCRSLWHFSLATNQWTHNRRFYTDVDGAELTGHFDEVAGEYLFSGMADAVYNDVIYNVTTHAQSAWACPWNRTAVADARHGRYISAITPIFSDRTDNMRYFKYDLDSRTTVAYGTYQFGGGLTAAAFNSQYAYQNDGWGMTYIQSLNRYWVVCTGAGNVTLWTEMDPTTTPWTLRPLSFANPPVVNFRPSRKLAYMPDLNAVLLCTREDRGFFIYKF